jgi:hypothetical protein
MIRDRVKAHTSMRIASGPFTGMQYITESVGSVLEPKLLGIYERELHSVIEEIIASEADSVIDIGAAEGYYAVGLAFRLPKVEVIAFETEAEGRAQLKNLAALNSVSARIQICGACGIGELRQAIDVNRKTAIVCDVEGAEAFLLDPHAIPELRQASILVEVHSKKCPGIKDLLKSRFQSSHDIRVIVQEPRTADDFPYQAFPVNLFPKAYLENAVSEFRQPWEDIMEWYWMIPK